jgi:phytoene desaturase
VVIGAGLGGLASALRLTGAGRSVRVLEASAAPGGLAGRFVQDGFTFDTGPTVLTMPSLIDDALESVGELRSDWLDLRPLHPAYTAHYADGSVLRSFSDPGEMSAEVASVCGPREAANYERLVRYLTELFRVEFGPFMDRNLDGLSALVRPEAATLLRMGGLRSLDTVIRRYLDDPRLRRLFTFQALYAGVSPRAARAIYGVIGYLDSIAGVCYPTGGMHAVAQALAGAAVKHGAEISYRTPVSRVELSAGRVCSVLTAGGERIPADVVVLNVDPASAYRELLPVGLAPRGLRNARYSPSAFLWHVGSSATTPAPAHHTISFGAAWEQTFEEIIRHGKLMSDPSLLITNPSFTDPGAAPPGKQSYYVLAPCPNLANSSIDWPRLSRRYTDEIAQVLDKRGFDSNGAFSSGVQVSETIGPADWAAAGLPAGTPFSLAHTLGQTGPLRHPTQHPAVDNLLFCGAGVQPGVGVPTVLLSGRLAAARVTG